MLIYFAENGKKAVVVLVKTDFMHLLQDTHSCEDCSTLHRTDCARAGRLKERCSGRKCLQYNNFDDVLDKMPSKIDTCEMRAIK